MEINYLKGDATNPASSGNKIIVHVCNDISGWGKGFVKDGQRLKTTGAFFDQVQGVSPPRKGEGNRLDKRRLLGLNPSPQRSRSRASPPPCGEGLGVGVFSNASAFIRPCCRKSVRMTDIINDTFTTSQPTWRRGQSVVVRIRFLAAFPFAAGDECVERWLLIFGQRRREDWFPVVQQQFRAY